MSLTDLSRNHLAVLAWALQRHGLNAQAIFADVGVSVPASNSPVDRVSWIAVIRILEHVQELTDDPCIGLKLYQHFRLPHLNTLGFALSCSDTLLDLFQRLQRFIHYVGTAFVMEIEEREDHYLVSAHLNHDIAQGQLKDDPNAHLLMTAFLFPTFGLAEGLFGGPIPIRLIHLPGHPHELVIAEYEKVGRAPVQAGGDGVRVEIEKTAMHAPLPGANPQLAQKNDQMMLELITSMNQSNIVHRCERYIIDCLPTGEANIKQVAKCMGISERILRHHLSEQGLSFSTVLNRIKKTLAIQHLSEGKKNISQIAYELGFDSASNFSRAFRGWTGLSPREHLKQQQNE